MNKRWCTIECVGITAVAIEGQPVGCVTADAPGVIKTWNGKQVKDSGGWHWEVDPADVETARQMVKTHNEMIERPWKKVV